VVSHGHASILMGGAKRSQKFLFLLSAPAHSIKNSKFCCTVTELDERKNSKGSHATGLVKILATPFLTRDLYAVDRRFSLNLLAKQKHRNYLFQSYLMRAAVSKFCGLFVNCFLLILYYICIFIVLTLIGISFLVAVCTCRLVTNCYFYEYAKPAGRNSFLTHAAKCTVVVE